MCWWQGHTFEIGMGWIKQECRHSENLLVWLWARDELAWPQIVPSVQRSFQIQPVMMLKGWAWSTEVYFSLSLLALFKNTLTHTCRRKISYKLQWQDQMSWNTRLMFYIHRAIFHSGVKQKVLVSVYTRAWWKIPDLKHLQPRLELRRTSEYIS